MRLFYALLEEVLSKYDSSHQEIRSKAEYDEIVTYLNERSSRVNKKGKTQKHYYQHNSYVVMQFAGAPDYLVTKKSYDEAKDEEGHVDLMKLKKVCPKEDVFEVIRGHHLMRSHAGVRYTWESVKKYYSNISRDVVSKYVDLCTCKVNQRLPSRAEGITPIISKMFNDRSQMDLIDMTGQAYQGYRWILHYQDHLMKFLYLKALKMKEVSIL